MWYATIDLSDVWRDKALEFKDRRIQIVAKIQSSGWDKLTLDPEALTRHLGHLWSSESEAEFDLWFQGIYDLADEDRIWIET